MSVQKWIDQGRPTKDDEARQKQLVLLLVAIGYGSSMLAFRPTVMMSLPTVLAELGLSPEDGGILLSTCQGAYMISKPLAQVLSDSVEGPVLLRFSLICTAVACCAVPLARERWQLQSLLFALMVAQAPHAPAAMRIVANWFQPVERGKAFSAINGSVNVVSCLVPVLVNTVLLKSSWHVLYVGIGIATLGVALLQLPFLSDRPPSESETDTDVKKQASENAEFRSVDLLRNGALIGCGLLFALLYGIRFGMEGWIGTFLKETATHPGTLEAAGGTTAIFLFWWQVGGFFGSFLLGPASDYFGGRTLPLAVVCAMVLSGAAGVIHSIDHADLQATYLLPAAAAASGACVYGLRLLFNLFTRAQVPRSVAGKADALVSSLAEMGGVLAGFPLISLVTYSGSWSSFTAAMIALSGLLCIGTAALALCCPASPSGGPTEAAKKTQ